MGTYIPMADDQRDAATMLYLRDPLPNSQTETPLLPGNIMYMNFSSSSTPYSDMDVQPVANSDSNSSRQVLLSFGGSRSMDNQVVVGGPNLQGQGLSLSLGTHVPSVMQISPMQYQNDDPNFGSMLACNNAMFENADHYNSKHSREDEYVLSGGVGSSSDANDVPMYGSQSIARAVPNSKYLKATQELLNEVVNVRQAIKDQNARKESGESMDGATEPSSAKATGNSSSELSVSEKHEQQNKLTKLLSMLDEVDRRYRQYYHQMQIVVCSFDVVAGSGASKPYTALALQTISRHFRCLRDAINGQIQTARKSLGEDDAALNNKGVGISRLRFVDQQLRQQRALQQLGMMQQHAWRPQRGLPETSVSILRAWLFEHFLHPYPKDSDKIMLARQTGLTRSQVSNWFINARVRLWKPMVEEMYKEETGDADMDSNSSSETIPKEKNTKASEEKGNDSTISTGRLLGLKPDQISNVELMKMMQAQSEKNFSMGEETTRDGQRQNPFPEGVVESSSGNDRFMEAAAAAAAYHMSEELERFGNVGDGVSLTLGLQQGEGRGSVAMAESSHFEPPRDSDMYNAAGSDIAAETAEFEYMDSSNQPHRFVSSLLPSFS
ncbi:BEL1-like homeodomain protein 7 [Andrographis paniculata]|uniref:BEL1-like homeodomain protein 7 n=1 Tax=Andrographis paniculata TaxID=175694 RepID=UPI0021E70089|nr:BEL1-like homeodomain protein 7 [Andrographis paniculata]